MNYFAEDHPYAPLIPIKKRIFDEHSKYQHIEVYETEDLGNMLVLDGAVQLTDKDNFIYHEMITYPALAISKKSDDVLIIGGGDGGTAKEVLKFNKHANVELVDIDEKVIEVSKRFFPEVSSALNKINVVIDDGIEFVKRSDKKRDIIIVDSTDPTPLAEGLFSKEFYEYIHKLSSILVAQTDSPISNRKAHLKAIDNMKKVFKYVYTYLACIPTYPGSIFSFSIGMDEELGEINDIDIKTKYYTKERFLVSMNDFTKDIME